MSLYAIRLWAPSFRKAHMFWYHILHEGCKINISASIVKVETFMSTEIILSCLVSNHWNQYFCPTK